MTNVLDPIPAPRRDDVRSALTAAFGGADLTEVAPIVGGVSALSYRVEIGSRAYVLRLEGQTGPLNDPARGYACLSAAAEAGVAPPLRYADPVHGVAIVDFIAGRPFAQHPGGPTGLIADYGRLIARLQTTPLFPAFVDYPALLRGLLARISGPGLFSPGLLTPHAEALARVLLAWRWDSAGLASSHNDPNPRNLIFDGARLWLIDWETAFRNDPLVDLAVIIDELAPTTEMREALLHAWLGQAPDRELCARLLITRQLTRLYYAGLMLSRFAAAPPAQPDTDLAAPTPDQFRAALATGRLKVGTPDLLYSLGKMQLAGFLGGMATAEVQDALAVLGHG